MHIRADLIVPTCAYTCRPDHAYVRIHAWACSHQCVHIRASMFTPMCEYMHAGMIVPLCAYTCRHDCAYLVRRLVGMKILRANKTRPNVINLKPLTLCMHKRASMFMRHSGQLFDTKVGTMLGCSWQQPGESLKIHALAQTTRGVQCRSQAIMPMLSGQARWCTKIVES
jgi:hypothetical protein